MLWANSADSHFLEPAGLWGRLLPEHLAARMPRTERVAEDEEIVHVDGESFRRRLPRFMTRKGADGTTIAELSTRAPGAADVHLRLQDLDAEGIWAEVMYASTSLWFNLLRDQDLVRIACGAVNEWITAEIQDTCPDRLVPTGMLPLRDVDAAVAELEHCAGLGLHIVYLPTGVPDGMADYHEPAWEPFWSAAEETGIVVGFHIGTDGDDPAGRFRGPGGAVLNYVETTYGGQRTATKLVASGALHRHPQLRVLISEGGATWVPFIGDRMNEAYRQHSMFVRPVLPVPPKEILYRQVYTSFQHDESAPAALTAMGYRNMAWGSDYPHIEGTYGHTQETLHLLFDGLDEAASHRIRVGAFRELFPHVSDPPGGPADPVTPGL